MVGNSTSEFSNVRVKLNGLNSVLLFMYVSSNRMLYVPCNHFLAGKSEHAHIHKVKSRYNIFFISLGFWGLFGYIEPSSILYNVHVPLVRLNMYVIWMPQSSPIVTTLLLSASILVQTFSSQLGLKRSKYFHMFFSI